MNYDKLLRDEPRGAADVVAAFDMEGAKRLRAAVLGPLEVAIDRVLQLGWPVDRMSVTCDSTRGWCYQLRLELDRGRPHWSMFEVSLTSDLDRPGGACFYVTERWLTEPGAPT